MAKKASPAVAQKWAVDFLNYNNYPVTPQNIRNLIAWSAKENTTAKYNPLATIDKMAGSSNFNDNNGFPVQNYRSYQDGIKANSKHLQEHGGPIKTALAAGNYSVDQFASAVAADGWGSGHFGAAPAGYVPPSLGGATGQVTGTYSPGSGGYDPSYGTSGTGAPSAPQPVSAAPSDYSPISFQSADLPGLPGGGAAPPGSAYVGPPDQQNPQQTWQLITSQQYVSPETQALLPGG